MYFRCFDILHEFVFLGIRFGTNNFNYLRVFNFLISLSFFFFAEQLRRQCEHLDENSQEYNHPEDILPSYTLVSGLPSYDAAIEQFTKNTPTTEYPSIFQIFRFNSDEVQSVGSKSCSAETPLMDGTQIVKSIGTETADNLLPSYSCVSEVIPKCSKSNEQNRNDKLTQFLTRLQSQISIDSTVFVVDGKSMTTATNYNNEKSTSNSSS